MIAAVLVVVACSDSGSPATEPVVTTTSSAPATTVAPPPTVDRVAEVQTIIQDLEERRLDALFREDEEAFRELFANDAYLELSLEVLGNLEFLAEPTDVIVEVREILADTGECLAVDIRFDYTQSLGPGATAEETMIFERKADEWAYSYAGTGWLCDGDHPLDE